ncbi:tripartite tricarboxylate transporter substrate binding protein [Hydrogenophaga sp. YM1]|jgi:tripartite-type tricarboxylate transporter receptor subunit TctC|uniref:Tripartite tricarboxylate transporter substrate binding protein n=1 Tax=Hydrogenophaga borbori TaxID=2294117 RepID=A0A372EN02_9BURK|nr:MULTISPECIES: tripartite tricarboxylate transporter substrate binding protein [Hydrogenophaga]NCT98513.1 tripartite tricarboxylate transporter substrate binding protein [Comamonadaceae bacterium]MBN9373074.1 tripartite tricarboxylate transporter substrate binding protein [Hydrogenophaga sp.]OJV66319.1 MAG: ABC transporter substrate-binding protein [Hydrogenophaga sp. 70-12]QRR35994.1 tripartite tricarboxylate transporter substrate binding protein [Hydrogenophaga sp. YM1]RFP80985.1 tripartit
MKPSALRRALGAALGASALLALAAPALANEAAWPTKPIRVIVTFPPGGSADAIVRAIGPRVSEKLGQPLVIENRPGAGGNIGLTAVAKAEPDGHTVGLGAAGALSANVSLYPQMPYDPVKDFKPVSLVAAIPFVFVGHPSVGVRTQAELIALAKRDPSKLTIGHGGNGTAMHLTASLFDQMAGTKIVQVAYRGSGPAAVDALAGQIPLAVTDLPAALPHIRAGKLQAFSVTSDKRVPALPDVPTVAEAGLAGYESVGWFGIVAPAATPDAIVNKLNAALVEALNDPATQATIRGLGVEPAPTTPKAFGDYIKSETTKWAKVIRTAGIKLE